MPGQVTRRDAMRMTAAGAMLAMAKPGTSAADLLGGRGHGIRDAFAGGKYVLPALPYKLEALEPAYSAEILKIHHGKHHAGYVRGLNGAMAKFEAARKSGDFGTIKDLSRALAFHGSGHMLHTLFWNSMTPGGAKMPAEFEKQVKASFGSVAAMAGQFAAATKAVEGSGWGVLAWEPVGMKMIVLQAEKHQNLGIWGVVPLLVCDVWEHAYYLQYKNARGSFVDAFMKIANWPFADSRLTAARGQRMK